MRIMENQTEWFSGFMLGLTLFTIGANAKIMVPYSSEKSMVDFSSPGSWGLVSTYFCATNTNCN